MPDAAQPERWTIIRRNDWAHDNGYLLPPSLEPPDPDEHLEVIEVVPASALDDLRGVAEELVAAVERLTLSTLDATGDDDWGRLVASVGRARAALSAPSTGGDDG